MYQQWAKAGAVFHYVSNSPWPLECEFESFLDREGFPSGTTHLRPFSARGTVTESLFTANGHHKEEVLRSLMTDFPRQKFILVGDSGERDPEIYGTIARSFPDRVAKIFIRRVTLDRPDRYSTALGFMGPHRWGLFDEAMILLDEELP